MVVYRSEKSQQEVELAVHVDLVEDIVAEFRTALYAELDRPHRLVTLNLEGVRIINSAALGAILLFQKKARETGMDLVVSRCTDELRRTFLAIRLDRILTIQGENPPTVEG